MELLFFLTSEFGDEDVQNLRRTIEALRSSHDWMEGAPVFVDEIDEGEEGDLRTVGGVIDLPAVGPRDVERRAFEDVTHLIEALKAYSEQRRQELEFEFDGTFVGDIKDGTTSRTLELGFLEPWRERIQ